MLNHSYTKPLCDYLVSFATLWSCRPSSTRGPWRSWITLIIKMQLANAKYTRRTQVHRVYLQTKHVSTLAVIDSTYWGALLALHGHPAADSWRSLSAKREIRAENHYARMLPGTFLLFWWCDSPSLLGCPCLPAETKRGERMPNIVFKESFSVCLPNNLHTYSKVYSYKNTSLQLHIVS